MKPREARTGDRLIRVACCGNGPVLVLAHMRPEWRCTACKTAGVDAGEVVLS